MTVDCAMTAVLLLLMGYSRVGEAAHEWLDTAMLVLFVIHHIINRKRLAAIIAVYGAAREAVLRGM